MTPEQIQQLKAPLDRGRISTRKQGGTELSYLEGWDDIATANRIFGYDQWDRELVELTQVEARDRTDEEKKGYRASYHAKVRVTVHAEDRTTVREGIGSGHGYGYSLGEAVESAVKEAETDAMKRALSTWGNQFGLCLYDKQQRGVAQSNGHNGSARKAEVTEEDFIKFILACEKQILTLDPERVDIILANHQVDDVTVTPKNRALMEKVYQDLRAASEAAQAPERGLRKAVA